MSAGKQQQQKFAQQAKTIEAAIRSKIGEADVAKIIDDARNQPFAARFLIPYIDAAAKEFQESIWSMNPEDFSNNRAAVLGLLALKTRVLMLTGASESLLKDANRLQGLLEKARESGRILFGEE